MGGGVLLADVRLELDDPPDAAVLDARAFGVADEASAQQDGRCLERRPGQDLATEDRQADGTDEPPAGNRARSASGMKGPRIARNPGIRCSRSAPAVTDGSYAW